MDDLSDIAPGAQVRAGDDQVIGMVAESEGAGTSAARRDSIVVLAQDGAADYRIPLSAVRSVDRASTPPTVYLTLAPGDLRAYQGLSATQTTQTIRSTQTTAGQAGQSAQTTRTMGREEWRPQTDDATLRIPVIGEELTVQTQEVRRGTVRIHKGTETLEQALTVPVYYQEAVVERIPVDRYDPDAALDAHETIIPVYEEQLVVEKRTVVIEYIRLRTTRVTEEQTVRGTLRREVVTVTQEEGARR